MKLHYIIDEELSGKQTKVEREYVEVDREAKVGDYFVSLDELGGVTYGTIYRVESLTVTKIHGHRGRQFFDDGGIWRAVWSPYKYKTLEPTEYVRIDGKRYKLADRRAEVGEQIIVVSFTSATERDAHISKGDVLTVSYKGEITTRVGMHILFDETDSKNFDDKYYVLEPAEESEEEPPKTTEDLVASLAAEVARLKRKFAELEEQTDSNSKDLVKQAEELAELKGAQEVTIDAEEVATHLLTEVLMRERRFN